MTYFPDLSPYIYFRRRDGCNVGWLDPEHPYSIGTAPEEFVAQLQRLFRDHQTMRTRGFHRCPFCKPGPEPVVIGNSELAVRVNGTTYRAPSLILHYVTQHQHLPPPEFIGAVMHGEPVP